MARDCLKDFLILKSTRGQGRTVSSATAELRPFFLRNFGVSVNSTEWQLSGFNKEIVNISRKRNTAKGVHSEGTPRKTDQGRTVSSANAELRPFVYGTLVFL